MQHDQASRPHHLRPVPKLREPPEREELTCVFCGLIYPQTVTEYIDAVMHDQCPRCRQVPRHLTDDV